MIRKLRRRFEVSALKRFVYTYKKILVLAYKVSPRLLILITLINAFWGLTNLPVLYINKTLIDLVINNIGKSDLAAPLRMILVLVAVRAAIEFARNYLSSINSAYTNNFSQKIQAYLEVAAGIKLNSLDIPTVESPEFQDKYKKIERESNSRLWGMIWPLSNIPNYFFTIISAVIPLVTFNPWISLLVLVVTLPDIIVNSRLAKRDYEALRVLSNKWRLWGWVYSYFAETRHSYENKVLGNMGYLAKKLGKVQKEVLDYEYKRRVSRAVKRNFASVPGYILSLLLNAYFFGLALFGRITLGTAQLLYQATNTLALGFGGLMNDAVSIYENYLFVSDLTWFLELQPEIKRGNRRVSRELSGGIEFKNVWFKYPETRKWILKGVDFTIGAKENAALVGENGVGKTTLIKLLCGFYKPTRGEILVNGVNIFKYKQKEYWRLLGVLFQDFSWYAFSGKESIGIGDIKRIGKVSEIKKAAKLTGIDKFFEGLPLRYENPLSKEFDKGVAPSKGQWQRIALSRILFRGSKIIVLDEPTSNVDPEAEEEIFEKIIALASEKILILISHRFSTVRKADKIFVIEDGKIVEQGSHMELMGRNGKYAYLFNLQAKGYQ